MVVTWQPEAIIAKAFADPQAQTAVRKHIFGHPDWIELDRGTLPLHQAIAQGTLRTGLPEAEIASLLHDVPFALVAIPETVALLYRLKSQGHRLFCLSNMHVASIEHLERTYTFWEVFTGTVISCRINLCKPEPAIYAYLLETHGLDAKDTVFIDDVAVNLSAAERFGIRTIQFESPAQCDRRLREMDCI